MKYQSTHNASKGFTLIELIVVIVIIGVLASIFAPAILNTGIKEGAVASGIKTTGDKIITNWKQIVISAGVNKDPVNSPLFLAANHDMLDVLASGVVAVSAAQSGWYNTDGPSTMGEITVVTTPTATAAGSYLIADKYPISLTSYTAATGLLLVALADVDTAVVSELVDMMDKTSSFVAATPDTTGRVQYGAADTDGEHAVTLQYYVK
jgi:prepilin-type N-terminal cleavage/methylation domain-containing protein